MFELGKSKCYKSFESKFSSSGFQSFPFESIFMPGARPNVQPPALHLHPNLIPEKED